MLGFELRARGTMRGLAAGAMIGWDVRGWTAERIAELRPDGLRFVPGSRGDPDPPVVAEALAVARAAATGTIDPDALAADLERIAGDVSGNPLGRCAPLAIRWREEPQVLARQSIASAIPTQRDETCGWCCAAFNLLLAALLRDEEEVPDADALLLAVSAAVGMADSSVLADAGYTIVAPPSVRRALRDAESMALDSLVLDGDHAQRRESALVAAMVCARRGRDPQDAVAAVVEAGGDAAVNGAVAGAVMGTKARFPDVWGVAMRRVREGRPSLTDPAVALMRSRR